MSTTEVEETITASIVPATERIAFLPKFFGGAFMRGEGLLYNWAGKLCPQYQGGFWSFYTLSNGGFFASPETSEQVEISVDTNGYCGSMSPQSAGVVITLFALNHLIAALYKDSRNESLVEKLTEHYYQLRDFISSLPDAKEVFSAID